MFWVNGPLRQSISDREKVKKWNDRQEKKKYLVNANRPPPYPTPPAPPDNPPTASSVGPWSLS